MKFSAARRFAVALFAASIAHAASDPIALWPGVPPGEKGGLPAEADTSKPGEGLVSGKPIIRLGNVSNPTMTVFPAPAEKATGAAVLVCPGGGYHILAMDLEGSEVCEWLNSIGVTAMLLKYRVPAREGLPKHAPALQDAQRAMGIIRKRAGEWGIDPARVGCLGFSAGGHLCAALSASAGAREAHRASSEQSPGMHRQGRDQHQRQAIPVGRNRHPGHHRLR